MRYDKVTPFYKHLISSKGDYALSCYAIFAPDPDERKYLADLVSRFIEKSPSRYDEENLPEMLAEMKQPSLFGDGGLVLFDGELKKKQEESFLEALTGYSAKIIFACPAKLKILGPYFEKVGAVLDLTQAKKWEKEARFKDYVQKRLIRYKKRMGAEALELLFQKVGLHLLSILSELEKVLLFIGDREEITRKDIDQMVSKSEEELLWKVADSLVWKKRVPPPMEKNQLPLFFSSLRTQFQMGYQMIELMERKENIAPYFPRLWPKIIEEKKREAMRLGKAYFKKGLIEVFEADLAFRDEKPIDPLHLYARLTS